MFGTTKNNRNGNASKGSFIWCDHPLFGYGCIVWEYGIFGMAFYIGADGFKWKDLSCPRTHYKGSMSDRLLRNFIVGTEGGIQIQPDRNLGISTKLIKGIAERTVYSN